MISFDSKGLSKCNDGYYMAGLYRGGCDELRCIEKIKCCKMYPSELCYLSYRGRLFKTLSHFLITVLTLLLIIVNFNNFFVQPAPVI